MHRQAGCWIDGADTVISGVSTFKWCMQATGDVIIVLLLVHQLISSLSLHGAYGIVI